MKDIIKFINVIIDSVREAKEEMSKYRRAW